MTAAERQLLADLLAGIRGLRTDLAAWRRVKKLSVPCKRQGMS
jgi:hypothetical protein